MRKLIYALALLMITSSVSFAQKKDKKAKEENKG